MAGKVESMDSYLAGVTGEQRRVLQQLRKAIQAAAPEAEEGVSYGLPAFLVDGKAIAAFSASAQHCSLYPMSGRVIATLAKELAAYETSKGTIRFTVDKPLPASLVRKVVRARLTELSSKAAKNKITSTSSSRKSSRPIPFVEDSQSDTSPEANPEIRAFLDELKHPLKPVIASVRQLVLSVSPTIQEGMKWNAPSFRTSEFFGTLNLRENRVWLILHSGAKVNEKTRKGIKIKDPTGLLKWLAPDRCVVAIENAEDLATKRQPLIAVLKQWIRRI